MIGRVMRWLAGPSCYRQDHISLDHLYPSAEYPMFVRTWPDGSQDVLELDGAMRHVPAKITDAGYINLPDFAATGVGRFAPGYPFDEARAVPRST